MAHIDLPADLPGIRALLTYRPHCPYFAHEYGLFSTVPGTLMLASTRSPLPGSNVWPWRAINSGL